MKVTYIAIILLLAAAMLAAPVSAAGETLTQTYGVPSGSVAPTLEKISIPIYLSGLPETPTDNQVAAFTTLNIHSYNTSYFGFDYDRTYSNNCMGGIGSFTDNPANGLITWDGVTGIPHGPTGDNVLVITLELYPNTSSVDVEKTVPVTLGYTTVPYNYGNLDDFVINDVPGTVTVRAMPAGIEINASSVPANAQNPTGTLRANVTNSTGAIIPTETILQWTSSNPAVIEITDAAAGAYTIHGTGTAQITVTASDNTTVTDTATVTISAAPATVEIISAPTTLTHHSTGTLQAKVLDSAGNDITSSSVLTYETNDTSVLTVDSTGHYTAVGVGTAYVNLTATAGGVSKTSINYIIQVVKQIVTIELQNAPVSPINDTSTGTFSVKVTYSDATEATLPNNQFTWTASNRDILNITDAGVWSGEKAGTGTITAVCKLNTSAKATTASITVNATPASIIVNGINQTILDSDTGTASAAVYDKHGTAISADKLTAAAWTSSNTSVLTVNSANGAWTAVSAGTANLTFTAAAGGKTASGNASVTVTTGPDHVIITGTPANIRVGNNATLTATVYDRNNNIITTGVTNTWTSGSGAVLTVDSTGKIEGRTAGTANITVESTVTIGSIHAAVNNTTTDITVSPQLQITITEPANGAQIKGGVTQNFTAEITGLTGTGTYTWNLGDGSAASTQNTTHSYTDTTAGLGAKTVNVTVTDSTDGASASAEITLTVIKNPRTESLTIEGIPDLIYSNKTGTVRVNLTDQYGDSRYTLGDGETITITTNNSAVFNIIDSSAGTYKTENAGTARITADVTTKAGAHITNHKDTTVKGLPKATAVVISGVPQKIISGTSGTLTGTVIDQYGAAMPKETVTWTASGSITIDSTGRYTAGTVGTGTITAECASNTSISVTTSSITIQNAPENTVTSITVDGASNLYIGEKTQLSSAPLDANSVIMPSESVTWTTSDENIATVSPDGTVTGIAAGTVTITAASVTDPTITQTFTITIGAEPADEKQFSSVEITYSPDLYIGSIITGTAKALDQHGAEINPAGLTFTWTSSNTTVATVTGSTITGLALGSSTIQVSVTNGTATWTDSITLNVKAQRDTTVNSITIPESGTLSTILKGNTGQIQAAVYNAAGEILPNEEFTWTSSDPSVIEIVPSTGAYRALAAGTSVLTVTSVTDPTKTSTITITVEENPNPASVPTTLSVTAPTTIALSSSGTASAIVYDQYGNEYTVAEINWTSSSPSTVSVSPASGKTITLTAAASGTAVITIESGSLTQTVQITVPGNPSPAPTQRSGGSTNTGNGNYKEYPRTISQSDHASFGTSLIVTSVTLSEITTGSVDLSYDVAEFNGKTYSYSTEASGVNSGETYGIKGAHVLYTIESSDGQKFWRIFKLTSKVSSGEVIRIDFKVPISELAKQRMTTSDVILYHGDKDGKKWMPLDTYLVSVSGDYAYYYAETHGTSPFGILFAKDMTIIDETKPVSTAAPTSEETITPAEPAQPTAQPTKAKSPLGLASLLSALCAVGVLTKLRRK